MRKQQILPFPEDTKINEIGLTYKPAEDLKSVSITSPQDLAKFLHKIWNSELEISESFYIVLLNNAKMVTGYSLVSKGGATATIVDPASVLRIALLSNCNSFIVAHNHPSGYARPSSADIRLTDRLIEVGRVLGIPCEDHLIITADSHVSLRAQGESKF